MCGAVRFTIRDGVTGFGACHCEMCRRWSGSAFLAVSVPRDALVIEGSADIARIQSSDWAERAWCGKCGSNLWYRVTMEGAPETVEISLGLLDDTGGLSFDSEIFIDCKSDSFAFEGTKTRETMTRAEVFARYAPGAEPPS
ncbi:MAG: GFA family protein [Rhodobacteraceae bacterium]|nr:GFA family protein [Paracoccaceae bacterium]